MKKLRVDIGAYRFTPGFGCQTRVEALQSNAMRVQGYRIYPSECLETRLPLGEDRFNRCVSRAIEAGEGCTHHQPHCKIDR